MTPWREVWNDFRDAAARFSRPARLYIGSEFLLWTGHGIFSVLFNLALVEAGADERRVGQAIAAGGIGMVVAALPAGRLANRWGRRRTLMLGAALDALGHLARAAAGTGPLLLPAGFVAGAGQALFQIAAAPFLTEHSTPRERTHLFSAFFACALLAGVFGNTVGGLLPPLFGALFPDASRLDTFRGSLVLGALATAAAVLPLLALRGLREDRHVRSDTAHPPHEVARLAPIALNALLIGAGAGLVIPFMNLYFEQRFDSDSATIGGILGTAQVFTALATLAAPAVARRFGKLRTAVAAQLLSLPFLLTLGVERHLSLAAIAFWMRATFMQASTPLMQAFIMEVLPPALRARATSLNNLLWNLGWAASATATGAVSAAWGPAAPFQVTAALYLVAALSFLVAFRGTPEGPVREVGLSEEAKGRRGEGPTPD